jgi:hypothetical protein
MLVKAIVGARLESVALRIQAAAQANSKFRWLGAPATKFQGRRIADGLFVFLGESLHSSQIAFQDETQMVITQQLVRNSQLTE